MILLISSLLFIFTDLVSDLKIKSKTSTAIIIILLIFIVANIIFIIIQDAKQFLRKFKDYKESQKQP
jgi:hypothetical protein